MSDIADNIVNFYNTLHHLQVGKDRNQCTPTLLAVSKKHTSSAIREAYRAGVRHFGENILKEALEKQQQLTDLPDLIWHYLGHIQRNKTAQIAQHFSWVHSLDRLIIAQRLNDQRDESALPLNVCIQVNIDNEPQKSGISVEEVVTLAKAVSQLPRLRFRGLMAIGRKGHSESTFAPMQTCYLSLQSLGFSIDTLSIGMSSDWEIALNYGTTMVRLGTAIFGQRSA